MTTYKQKLEELFNGCVTAARDDFVKDGYLTTRWVVEDKNDVRILIVFTPDIPKDAMVKQMRKMAQDRDIARYVVEMETWMALGDGVPPSHRPDRLEALLVMGADRRKNVALATIEIERKGGKHYLGETVRGGGGDTVSGPFQIFEKEQDQMKGEHNG